MESKQLEEKVLSQAKAYELASAKRDPMFNSFLAGVDLVREFIKETGAILYGGTAIDMALRLKGDKIYDDESAAKAPDLDFYSPESVEHSYQLADLLYEKGFTEARVVSALHITTQRIDLGSGHWCADISYCPEKVFKDIPTLVYQDLHIAHPDFLRLDLHSSLCHPYGNPGGAESVFDRFDKDVRRFNLLNKHYPIVAPAKLAAVDKMHRLSISTDYKKFLFTGFLSYAILLHHFKTEVIPGKQLPPGIVDNQLEITEKDLTFTTFGNVLDMVHFDLEAAARENCLENVEYYEPLFNLRPAHCVGQRGRIKVVVFSSENELLSYNYIKLEGVNWKVVNIQGILLYYLRGILTHEGQLRAMYAQFYCSLLKMIEIAEDTIAAKYTDAESSIDEALKSPYFLSVRNVYGNRNMSLAQQVLMSNLLHDLYGAPLLPKPHNYYPERSYTRGLPHPVFDYDSSEFYRLSGRRVHAIAKSAPAETAEQKKALD